MIILLYGEDEFRSLEKLKEIENKFLSKNSSGSNPSYFDLEENNEIGFSEIKNAFNSKGLFGGKQLIIIKNFLSAASKELTEKTLSFLKSLANISEDKDVVAVFWEKRKTNEKSEVFKFLSIKSKKQKFENLSGAKLEQWIIGKVEEDDKVKISAPALEKLIACTGGELRVLDNEIQKLLNYKDAGVIDEEDVEILVKEKISSGIFETIEALSGANKKTALKLFHEQLEKGEDPLYILTMYVYQFRNFLKVSEYYSRGERNSMEIAGKTGTHPFVVKKILGQIARFSEEKIKEIYKRLQKIDEMAKTGKADAKIELDRFIVEI
ncbi:MAG: DNA polymerase III subunit delta [bacterium]|nr:DNA polymerase III subunit delta [bacterium]